VFVAGASAYARVIDFERFRQAADEGGAVFMVDMAHIAGLVAGGAHPNPAPIADVVTSTTHKTLRGPRSGFILCKQPYAKKIDSAVFPGTQGGPLGHAIAAKAVCFKEAAEPHFADYARQVVANAKVLAEELLGYGFRIVTGGTDNHMFLIDVGSKGLTGQQAEDLLWSVGVVANKNAIPFDTRPPAVTSGVRVGTPALTTRGMKEGEMRKIAEIFYRVLGSDRPENQVWARDVVKELCASFPLYHDTVTIR
jgi:glycine hydroxymethyltransferase